MTNSDNYDIINENGAGNKTGNGAEVFNDYENNTASGYYSHAEGENTTATGRATHAEGVGTSASCTGSHAEGENSVASGHGAHAENQSTAEGDYSHSEGYLTKTTGANSHAEGESTLSEGQNSHAEGENSKAIGTASHSEGKNTETEGEKSHAEGNGTKATASGAHAEGSNTTASGEDSHAEGKNTVASGLRSFAGGNGTVATQPDQTVIGRFNQNGTDTLFEVGNGTSDTERSNAFEVYKDGTLSIGGETVSPEQFERLLSMLGATKDKAFNVMFDGEQFTAQLSAGKEQWYKITTDIPNAHVNGNIGEYIFNITNGNGYEFTVYDSDSNAVCTIDPTESPLAPIELLYNRTYYLCVKALSDETDAYTLSFDYVNQRELLQNGFASAEEHPVWSDAVHISGEFEEPYQTKWYKIHAAGMHTHVNGDPGEYYFTVSSPYPTTVLYKPDGTELARNYNLPNDGVATVTADSSDTNTLTCMLDSGGYYYVAVKNLSGFTTPFSLDIDYKHLPYPGTTKEVAILMPYGQNCDGEFTETANEAWFKYTADKPELHSGGNPAGYCFSGMMGQDFVAEIIDENGDIASSTNPALRSRNFSMTVQMNLGNTCYLHLTAQNGGSGNFSVMVEPNNTIYNTGLSMDDAITLPFNKWVTGSIDTAGDSKWYKFWVEEHCDKVTVKSKSDIKVVGYLYDADGNFVAVDNDYPKPDQYVTPKDFVISKPLSIGYTYYVCVTGKGSDIGNFKLIAGNMIPVETFDILTTAPEIPLGKTLQIPFSITPSNATDKTLRWYSSNSAIASVDKNGVVTGNKVGSTNIYAVTEDGTNLVDYCTVYVDPLADYVSIEPKELTLCVGETEIIDLVTDPERGYFDSADWTVEEGTDVISVDSNGMVTALKTGTAKVKVMVRVNNEILTSECFITVKDEKVIIYRVNALGDEANGELRVRFTKSGKIWRVVNRNTIYCIDDLDLDPFNPPEGISYDMFPPSGVELARCYDNLFSGHDFDHPENHNPVIKEYTDDEIRLLYAIDPHGIADYVCRRAEENISSLKEKIDYKNEVFFKIFNREPRYYRRDPYGNWGEEKDTSNLSVVISESEIIFGMHPLYDVYAKQELFKIATAVISLIVTAIYPPAIVPIIATVDTTDKLQAIFSFGSKIDNILLSENKELAISQELLAYAFEKFELSWINDLLSLRDGLHNLEQTYIKMPTVCDIVYNYYIQNEKYHLSIELNEREAFYIEEIKKAVSMN